jgi:hypothetical protein
MVGKISAYDRVKEHLDGKGEKASVSVELRDDLETLVRRTDEIRGLGEEFGSIELSPFMMSLLGVSGLRRPAIGAKEPAVVGL